MGKLGIKTGFKFLKDFKAGVFETGVGFDYEAGVGEILGQHPPAPLSCSSSGQAGPHTRACCLAAPLHHCHCLHI